MDIFDKNQLLNMDCMIALKEYPDNYFDLAIVDPPYGINEAGKKNPSRSKLAKAKQYKEYHNKDKDPMQKAYFDELMRVSKDQIIFGANHFIENIAKNSSCWLVWDKENGKNDFADCELAWTSFKSAVRIFRFKWQGMLQGNMKQKEVRIHPNQKPVALYRWILQKYAKPGDLIIDTHVGSASSLIACYELGFDYIGFEIDEHYFNLAQKRIREAKAQLRMEGL